jgi:hypothetical protein
MDLAPGFAFLPREFKEPPPVAAVFLAGPAPANEDKFAINSPVMTLTAVNPAPKFEEKQESSNVVSLFKKI